MGRRPGVWATGFACVGEGGGTPPGLTHPMAQMLGPDQPVILNLIELPGAMNALKGVVMELQAQRTPFSAMRSQTPDWLAGRDWPALPRAGLAPCRCGLHKGRNAYVYTRM